MAQVCRVVILLCTILSGTTRASDSEAAMPCSQVMETLPDQSIDLQSFDQGAGYLGHLTDVSSDAQCMEACCKMEGCQLALAEPALDGLFDCLLLRCSAGQEGQDLCSLRPVSGYTAFRKKDADSTRADADVCRAPGAQVGNCRAAFPRFYYNVTDQTCKSFIYGGCGGNGNNFDTIEDCQATCSGVTGTVETSSSTSGPASRRMLMDTNPVTSAEESQSKSTAKFLAEYCNAPAETGFCRAAFPRFFYNASAGTCQSFTYGGCGGNNNNYATVEQCMATCSGKSLPNPIKSTKNQGACTAAYEVGPCRARIPSYYYNPQLKTCLPFIYGGCSGNSNRYGTKEECMATCGKAGGNPEHHSSHPNPAFFLVATLAVMSAMLLVGLILLLLQRAKIRRQAHDDKEELLPAEQMHSATSA